MTSTNELLSNSEMRYNCIISSIPDVIGELELDGTINFFNPQVHDLLGYYPDEIIGTSFIKFFHPEDVPGIREAMKEAIKSKEILFPRIRLKHKKGNYIFVSAKGKLIELNDGVKFIGVIRDITKISETKKKLEESQDIFKQLNEVFLKFKDDPIFNLQLLINAAGLLLKADFAVFNILKRENGDEVLESLVTYNEPPNFTRESNAKGRICTDIIKNNPDDVVIINDLEKTKYAKTDENIQKYNLKQIVSCLVRLNNKPIATFCVVYTENREMSKRDLTTVQILSKSASTELARWNVRIELQKSEKNYRSLVEGLNDALYRMSLPDGNYEYFSPAAKLVFGYSSKDFLDNSMFIKKIMHPDFNDYFKEKWVDLLKGNVPRTYEYKIIDPDNNERWITQSNKKIFDDSGNLIAIEGLCRNITESKEAEQKLKESEEKFRTAVESSPDYIVFIRANGTIFDVNRLEKGFTREEIIDQSVFNENFYETEDQLESVRKAISDSLETKETTLYEYSQIAPDGSQSVYETKVSPFRCDNEGKIISLQLTTRDITKRKKIEKELLFEKDNITKILNSMEDGVYLVDSNYDIEYVNPSLTQEFGKYEGKKCYTYFHDREDICPWCKNQEVFKGKIVRWEFFLARTQKTYDLIDTPLKNVDGSISKLEIFRDITALKATEKKIRDAQEKAESYLNLAGTAILALNKDGIITILNKKGHEILQYNENELIGKNWFKTCIPEQRQENTFEIFKQLLKGDIESVEYLEDIVITKTGEERTIAWNNTLLYDIERNIVGTLSSGENITERKVAEKKLKESEEKYRILVETAVMGLIEFDVVRNKVSYINPKLLEILGYTKEEFLDEKTFMPIVHLEDFINLTKPSEDKYVEFKIVTKDGKLKWLSGTRNNHFNQKGKLISARLWLQDSTKSKEIEEIKSNLLSRFSHEFKTPLISISGFADLLLTEHKNQLDGKTLLFLDRIKEGSDKLKMLITSFIESSQLEKAIMQVKLSEENLYDLINQVVEELEGVKYMRNHKIDLNLDKKLVANFDREKIYTVITNLLINAINFTPKGGKISIHSKSDKNSIVISIKDNGIGLDESEMTRLFTQFGKIERYGQGWDIDVGGMGMGLFLSKKIIELHDGKIGASSEGRNKGSTFYFSLPITK